MRLTHVCEYADKRKNKEPMTKIRNKLFDLENIEDKLGIELVTLFKALEKGDVFIKLDDGRIIDGFSPVIQEYPDFITFTVDGRYTNSIANFDGYTIATKDYGKTWALTKEELIHG